MKRLKMQGEFVMDQVLALEEVWKIGVGHIEEDI